jgi:DNA helicase II / ATP-dependent DNA helicase PcrA
VAVQLTVAGPGSGKTSTLTGRFVHLSRQGVNPRRILAVTITKKAADEMRDRIAGLLELPLASSLDIMTFHAFAFRHLKGNPGIASLPERFRLWDAAEQRHIFAARQMWLRSLIHFSENLAQLAVRPQTLLLTFDEVA